MVVTAAMTLQAQTDSKIAYQERQYLGNMSYCSSNPVSIQNMPIRDLADIKVEFGHTAGDLHSIDDAGRINAWTASFTGMKQVGKVTFSGGLVYHNCTLYDRRWNNTLFVSHHNPYIIGDSIASKFDNESFTLNGTAAYAINDKVLIGLAANYDVGNSATQKDPRPEINGMRFSLTPGAEFRFGRHSAGLSADVGWLSEEVTHTVIRTTTNQYLFLFQGLGVFESKDALGYQRKYNGMRYGGNLQYSVNARNHSAVADFLEIGYHQEYEDATDGASAVKYKGGRYTGSEISAYNRLCIRQGSTWRHNVAVKGRLQNSTGTWYTQKKTTDADSNLIYEVINEADNLKSTTIDAGLSYRLDRVTRGLLPTLSASVSADMERSETKNLIYGAKETYTNAFFAADVTKRFAIKKSWLGATLRGGYMLPLDNSINLDGMPATYSIVKKKYTLPAFDAMIAGYWNGGVELTYSLPLKISSMKTVLDLKVSADYRRQTGTTATLVNADRFYVGGAAGFVF